MSSNLVTVHDQEENVYIQHRHNGERSWIGLNDRSVEGSFVWTNKEISKFRFWAPQQPNDWKNEDCVHTLGAKHGYTWNDVPCTNCYNYTCFKGNKRSTIKIYNRIYLNLHVPDSESTELKLRSKRSKHNYSMLGRWLDRLHGKEERVTPISFIIRNIGKQVVYICLKKYPLP